MPHPPPVPRIAHRGQRVEQAVRDDDALVRPDGTWSARDGMSEDTDTGAAPASMIRVGVGTSMITNAVSRPPPSHHHLRVTRRHAATSDFAGALEPLRLFTRARTMWRKGGSCGKAPF